MTTYVALLRAINLGSRNRVAMPVLRDLLEQHGFSDVVTYVQSGNAVFRGVGRAPDVRASLEGAIRKALGLDITVLIRSAAQMARIRDRNPYPAEGAEPSTLHVTFLAEKPASAAVKALPEAGFGRDRFTVAGTEIYLHLPDGYGRSKLSNAFFERLKVAATTRNWKTVTALADLARG